LTIGSGQVFLGRTEDLSIGGTHLSVNLEPIREETVRRLADELVCGSHAVVELMLPDGVARFSCLVAAQGARPGDTRLRFVDVDGETADRLGRLLRDEQRRVAAQQADAE
jgi:hypothetical protein